MPKKIGPVLRWAAAWFGPDYADHHRAMLEERKDDTAQLGRKVANQVFVRSLDANLADELSPNDISEIADWLDTLGPDGHAIIPDSQRD